MISITKQLSKYGVVFFLLLVSNLAWPQEVSSFVAKSQVDDIGSGFIVINDTRYGILATTKVFRLNHKPGRLADIKKGDYIDITPLKIGKVRYAETIRLVPKP